MGNALISVLRLGHRKARDKRVTTHAALVARAFGADKITISGEPDDSVIESVRAVVKKWGGRFEIEYAANWRRVLKKFLGTRVHLTVYGEPIQDKIHEIRRSKNLLLIVGAAKVPAEVYRLTDYNISITTQPHSEVAALAVFLHEFFEGRELEKSFEGARIVVEPAAKGKKVMKLK